MLTVVIEKKKTLSSITPLNTESNGNGFVIIFLYVDSLIYMGNVQMIKDFERQIMSRFKMTGLGLMRYFLGMQVKQEPRRIIIFLEKNMQLIC